MVYNSVKAFDMLMVVSQLIRSDTSSDVLAAALLNPQDSSLRIAADSGLSQTTVLRILHENKIHPFSISRINFCLWDREKINEDPDLFNDEVTDGSNAKANASFKNPHSMCAVDNHRCRTLHT
ncbi:hypothetical protein J6590_041769 [Homalodisca vitripennis]|nr:hypothetical protein J6590_041769 [Homalodisca vitripennis]